MSNQLPHFALREWRRVVTSPSTWVVLLGVGVVLGLAGPFGTEEQLRTVPRILYWTVIVAATYVGGFLMGAIMQPLLERLPRWPRVVLSSIPIGLAVSCIVLLINFAAFGVFPPLGELPQLVLTITAIAFVIAVVSDVLGHDAEEPSGQTAPGLLDRLPLEKRGALVALSVEDHYTRVRTLRGEELVLMRLSDAIRETQPTQGAQVHRSHWVAFEHVKAVRRDGDRAIITLTTDGEIPVSRANISVLKEAGLLPK